MGTCLVVWGRFPTPEGNVTVPCPTSNPPMPYLWDWLIHKITSNEVDFNLRYLREIGFTAIQLPPSGKAQGGNGGGCDGYGVFDPMDQGDKNQQGSTPTRYGDFTSLRRLVAVAHANDMDVYHDVVTHQLIGANNGAASYRYLGSDGKTLNGRWPMDPGCFRGQKVIKGNMVVSGPDPSQVAIVKQTENIYEDDVPSVQYDFSFGDEISHENCVPEGYTIRAAIGQVNWLFASTGADGARLDDVKGQWAPFIGNLLYNSVLRTKYCYAEDFDNTGNDLSWDNSPPIHSMCSVEDFDNKFNIQNACNNGNAWALQNQSVMLVNPTRAWDFVDNPDTDTSMGQQTISNKELGYVEMLTNSGYCAVYGKDYFPDSVWPGAYGLYEAINLLVGANKNLKNGDPRLLYIDGKTKVKMSDGYPGMLTGINFDTWNNKTLTVPTSFGPNVELHYYYPPGKPSVWTNSNGEVTIEINANSYNSGKSWVLLSRPGYWSVGEIPQKTVTQTFFGASDLGLGPATNGTQTIAEIWIDNDKPVNFSFEMLNNAFLDNISSGKVELVDSKGEMIAWISFTDGKKHNGYGNTKLAGKHSFIADFNGLQGKAAFDLTVTYTAPREVELTPEELPGPQHKYSSKDLDKPEPEKTNPSILKSVLNTVSKVVNTVTTYHPSGGSTTSTSYASEVMSKPTDMVFLENNSKNISSEYEREPDAEVPDSETDNKE